MPAAPTYRNDGSGRDTFINHAGAYWMNPLPGGVYHKSLRTADGSATGAAGDEPICLDASATGPYASSSRHLAKSLFGQSRYGTTILQGGIDDAAATRASNSSRSADGTAAPLSDAPAEGFDPSATAMATIPDDVANPERRLHTPGHASTGLEGTGGASTYTGGQEPWVAPKQVDNTLLRVRPTYESTCHFGLRTGRFYVPDEAPAPESVVLEKTMTRYY